MKKMNPGWRFLLILAGMISACGARTPTHVTEAPTPTVAIPPTSTAVPAFTATLLPTPFPVEFVWKMNGDPNPFSAPVGIAIDPQGDIYVMDTKNARVQKFDRDGKFLLMWGSSGEGEGQFKFTVPDEGRLVIDSLGNVFVCDTSNFRIQKFDRDGKYLTQWGSNGNGDGQFLEPADIAIDSQNNIYVVDYRTRLVQKFDDQGKFLLRWGSTGVKDGEFAGLYSVAVTPDGEILFADESGRIQAFDSSGKFLYRIPLKRLDNAPIDTWNIAVDSKSDIYVADHGAFRVVKLDRQGNILAWWRGSETGAARFESLQDVEVDEQGNVYITDSASNLVQKFSQAAFKP